MSHTGGLEYLNETRESASLPDSTTSTGLPCLLVGAREHCGRSDFEVDHVATTTLILHSVHDNFWCPWVGTN